MPRSLVIGGAGFIGSNLADELLRQGHTVRIMDNFCSGVEANLSTVKTFPSDQWEVIKGDICNMDECLSACKDIDYVFLLAALRSVPGSMKEPHEYNRVNVDGIVNVLDACSKQGVKRLVFSSSSSIYGDTDLFPQVEDHLPLLISPYALSKLTGEYYCRIYSEFFNVETVCLRYFNVFGPRQSLDDEYAVVIPKFTYSVMKDEQPPIFGDGHQSRDFVYVENVVHANILSATTPGIKHEIFNVANGKETEVLDIVNVLNQTLGKNVQAKHLPKRDGDVYRTLADISKIQKRLGWEPKISFSEGLARTVEYFKTKF